MKTLLHLFFAMVALACTSCTTVDNYARANQKKFVALGDLASSAVDCRALQETVLADGRLQVRANLFNRTSQRIQVQVNCVFKDEQGFSTGDETPFQALFLDENAQETVTFTSLNKAKDYTVRVRLQR